MPPRRARRGHRQRGHRHHAARRPDARGTGRDLDRDGAAARLQDSAHHRRHLRLDRAHRGHLLPDPRRRGRGRAAPGPDRHADPHPADGPRALRHRGAVHRGRHQAHRPRGSRPALTLLLLIAQMQMTMPAVETRLSGQGVFIYTIVDPVPGGGTLGEARLTQPILMFHGAVWGGGLRLLATVDLEGVTIPGGELTPGAWGEGYVDRRHPHTYSHEVMLVAAPRSWLMLAAGKGFVPFGSDDPMSRPDRKSTRLNSSHQL